MNIATIHYQYQVLKESLQFLSHSGKNQLLLIDDWMAQLLSLQEPESIKSYLREEIALIIKIAPEIDPIGCPPEFFAGIRRRLQIVGTSFPKMFHSEEMARCLASLRVHEQTILSYLGSPYALNEENIEEPFLASLTPGLSEYDILLKYIGFPGGRDDQLAVQLEKIAADWRQFTEMQPGSVHIPLLIQDMLYGQIERSYPFGKIVRLRASVSTLPGGATKSSIVIPKSISEAESSALTNEIENALQAAETIGKDYIQNFTAQHAVIHIGFDDVHSSYAGRSLGLGTAANLLSLFSIQSNDKKYYCISGASVLSGSIEPSGTVLALDERAVRTKVETAFYSPYQRLVIPKQNESTADAVVSELMQKYPSRRLEIIPVRNLKDVFNQRQVTMIVPFTIHKRIRKLYRRYQAALTGSSLALLMILLLGYFLLLSDFDTNPFRVGLQENYYTVQNKNGKVLWKTPYAPEEMHFSVIDSVRRQDVVRLTKVIDLNNDGKNEVLISHSTNFAAKGFSDNLSCYNFDGTTRWNSPIGIPISTTEGNYLEESAGMLRIEVFHPTDTSLGIIACSSDNYYSCVLQFLDVDGRNQNNFLHLGYLNEMRFHKVPGSNETDLLLSGTNNGFKKPILLVVDPAKMAGVCPQSESHRLLSPILPAGTEKYYIKFPDTDVGTVLPNKFNLMSIIRFLTPTGFTVEVEVAYMPKEIEPGAQTVATVFYSFDWNMHPTKVMTQSTFDHTRSYLVKTGKLHGTVDNAYKEALMKRIEYWDGDKFVSEPTINRHYQEIRNRKSAQ